MKSLYNTDPNLPALHDVLCWAAQECYWSWPLLHHQSYIRQPVPGPRLTLDRTIPCVSPSTGCRGKCMMLIIIDPAAHSSKADIYAKLEYAGHSNNAVFMLNLWYLIMMASICVHSLLEISSSTTRWPQNNQIFKMWPLSVQNKDILL